MKVGPNNILILLCDLILFGLIGSLLVYLHCVIIVALVCNFVDSFKAACKFYERSVDFLLLSAIALP